MGQIGSRVRNALQSAEPGSGTMLPQFLELRENEPHPVALFVARAQFFQDIRVDGILSIYKLLQIH